MTYVPIIPVRSLFSLDAALPVVIEKIRGAVETAGYDSSPSWVSDAYIAPPEHEVRNFRDGIQAFRSAQQRSAKVLTALERIEAGLNVIDDIRSEEITQVAATRLSKLFGAEWPKIKDKIVKNNYSPALHFLPSDGQDPVFSGVQFHSVALFRYPITVPVRMLNHAAETSDAQWHERVRALKFAASLREAFAPAHPIKLSSLRAAFLSDLLTRFSALYNRVGSPDFTPQTINSYLTEVDS